MNKRERDPFFEGVATGWFPTLQWTVLPTHIGAALIELNGLSKKVETVKKT